MRCIFRPAGLPRRALHFSTGVHTYDTLGRVTSVTTFDAPTGGTTLNQVARVYGGFGEPTGEWQAHTGLVDTATTPQVQYAFSQGTGGNHSRLTRITYPSGYAVDYAYTGIDAAVSRPTSLSGVYRGSTPLPPGAVVDLASTTFETFKYLGADTVIERSRPEVNVTLSMVNFSGTSADAGDKYTGLDRFGRVVDQRWTQGTAAASPVVDRYGYTYDRNSNRLTRSNPLATDYSDTYTYDPLNQLQTFTRAGGALSNQVWQFDALGNWTSVTNDGNYVARTTNAQNELTQMGGFVLAYSPTGNVTTDANGRTLSYDAWNRLVSVKDATGTLVARYEYDGLNRRIVEQVGTLAAPSAATAAIRDVFFSQDWQVLEERLRTTPSQVATTADTRFVWSPVYVDAMIARDRNADGNAANGLEERVYALQDANWNTTAIIAAAGVPGVATGGVINRFAYTPYGRRETLTPAWATLPAGSTPAVAWWHAFQGLEFTDVTNLGYARNRDYNASMGRFIQRDPIGFDAGDNNWYRFVGNGPTGKTDPWGLSEGQWHHMIPQNNGNFRELFGQWGISIDGAEFGRIMTANDHSCLHAAKVNGKNYVDHWRAFVAKGKPTRAQLDSFLRGIERDFADYLKNAHKTRLSFQEWGRLSTELKDAVLKAKQTGRASVVLKRAGVAITLGTLIYNANAGGVVFAADQAVKDLVFYDDLDPLLRYAAYSSSTHIVTFLTGRPDGLDYEVNSCRCLQCRKLPDNCRCEGGPWRP